MLISLYIYIYICAHPEPRDIYKNMEAPRINQPVNSKQYNIIVCEYIYHVYLLLSYASISWEHGSWLPKHGHVHNQYTSINYIVYSPTQNE